MTRLQLIFIIALILFLGSLTTVFASANERDFHLRGYVDPIQTTSLPFRIPRVGINVDLTRYSPDELAHHLEMMRGARVTWVRQFIHTDRFAIAPDAYDWTMWDPIFAVLESYPELKLVPVFFGAPSWLRDQRAPDAATSPPSDPSAFAQIVAAFAQRYAAQIDTYQIWDEPNLMAAWGGLEPRPADYAELLAQSARAIRSVDADAHMLAAALAPTVETGPRNLSDLVFLTELYRLGADEIVDGFAAKPYGFSLPPDDRLAASDHLNFSRVVALRDVMVAHGDSAKALWISEFGWNALPSDWTGEPSIWGQVTQQQQAAFTRSAFARAEREWAWLGGMILSWWQPGVDVNDPVIGFSIIAPDDQPTPLYAVLRDLPAETASNGHYPAANPYTEYAGVWTFGDLGADVGWVQDSRLTFRFQGRDVAFILRQGDYEAYLYTTIDHAPANATPRDADGNAFINLKSDTLETQLTLVPVGRGYADSAHTLRAAADRGWDQWALVGYAVSSGDLAAPFYTQISIALLTAVVTGLAALAAALVIDWSPFLRRITSLWHRLSDAAQIAFTFLTSAALLVGMFITWGDSTPAIFRREPVQIGAALLTAGVIYLEPGFIVTLLAAAMLFILFYHRIDLALLLALLFAPFFLFPVELLLFAFPMTELIILLAGAAWLLRGLRDIAYRRRAGMIAVPFRLSRMTALDFALLAWVAVGLLSLTWTQYREPALTELRTLILEPVLFYVMLRSLKPDVKLLTRLVDALLAAGVVVCLVGIFMFITGTGAGVITAEAGTARLASVYGSPNNVALFLGRCIPFALAFALIRTDTRRRLYGAAVTSLMTATGLLTLSAGGLFIGIPAALVAVLLLTYRRRARWAIMTLLGMGGVAAALAMRSARFARLLDFSEGTNFFRLRVWQSALQIIRDHPITGLGLDQFLYAFRGRYMLPDAWQEPALSHPHNIILDYWTRLGIYGVILLFLSQFAFWRAALHAYRRMSQPISRALIIGAMGSMVNLLAHGIVDNSVFVQDLAYIYVLMIGLIASFGTSELLTTAAK